MAPQTELGAGPGGIVAVRTLPFKRREKGAKKDMIAAVEEWRIKDALR